MNLIAPKIQNKYHFKLIDTITGKISKEIITHNEVTASFWGADTYYDSQSYALCLSEKEKITEARDIRYTINESVSERTYKGNNVIKYVYTLPASTQYVGNFKSFCTVFSPTHAESYFCMMTQGKILDAEGNPIVINKTALDKLIVEVEWQFSFTSDTFKFLEGINSAIIMQGMAYHQSSAIDSGDLSLQGALKASIYISTLPPDKGIIPVSIPILINPSSYSYGSCIDFGYRPSTEWSVQKLSPDYYTIPLETKSTRIMQEVAPGRYINRIGLDGIGYIALPNSAVFPVYELSDIDVGTGDGSTTAFECPIPWFLKGTDKVYKNGQLLTRDVDYTIDNKHNRQKCLSISEGNFAKIISCAIHNFGEENTLTRLYSSNNIIPFSACIDVMQQSDSAYIFGRHPRVAFNPNIPLILDMEKETEINYFVSPYINGGSKLKLYYSNDNVSYTYVGEVDVLSTDLTDGAAIPDKHKLSFATVSARYWKIEITSSSTASEYLTYSPYGSKDTINTEETKTYTYNRCGFLGYVGEPIKFKTPPAEGDIITMDVSLDRPYKTTQNVIDIAFKYNY